MYFYNLADGVQHLLLPDLTITRPGTLQAHQAFTIHDNPGQRPQSRLDLVDLQRQNSAYLRIAHSQYSQASSDREHPVQALQAHPEVEKHVHLQDLELLGL